jgi:hypothetical protein
MIKQDLEELFIYMNGHCERLTLDIKNAEDRKDDAKVEYYKGAKGATDMFLRLMQDVLEKNQ